MDKDASTIEIAYFNRFHVPMARELRLHLCGLQVATALDHGLFAPGLGQQARNLGSYLVLEVGAHKARDELREIGEQAGHPFAESDLAYAGDCFIRLALNAAHQIAIDEERARG